MHPGMKRIFCLLTTNDLGRFAPSALPHDKHIWALLCRKQATTVIDPSPMAKNQGDHRYFSRREIAALVGGPQTDRRTGRPTD